MGYNDKNDKELDKLLYLKKFEHPEENYWKTYWYRLSQRLSYKKEPVRKFEKKWSVLKNILFPGFSVVATVTSIILIFYVTKQYTEILDLKNQINIQTQYVLPVSMDNAKKAYKIFSETKPLFSNNLKWIVMDGDEIKLGINEQVQNKIALTKREPILLEFKLFLIGNEKEPMLISNPNVVLYSGNDVIFKVQTKEKGQSRSCAFECIPELKRKDTLKINLKFSMDGTTLNTNMNIVEGKTLEIGKFISGEGQYLLTITMLKKHLKSFENKQEVSITL